MAARAKYPAPHEQLSALAREARLAGISFDEFWEEAIRPGQSPVTWQTPEDLRPYGAVIWPRDTTDRNISIAATLGAREGWKRAYDRLPPHKGEKALARLRPGLEALAEVSELRSEGEIMAAA